MTGAVPNTTEEFGQLQLLCSIYSQNNPVMLQQVKKFYTQQSVNIHLILPTHVLQHIVSLQDLQNGKYKTKHYVLTIRENYIEAPPQTTSQEYILLTLSSSSDIVYPFNFYNKEKHEFTVQLCDLVPIYCFTLYAPDFNDPQYQQYGVKNVLYQFKDNNILNIQQNNRQMQQLSYQILNLDEMITENCKICEDIEQRLYDNFKAQVKYVQDVNMFNINKINTIKQELVSQLNKFNRLVNATVNCLQSLKVQEQAAQSHLLDGTSQQSIYSTNYTYNQLNNIDLIVSNLTSISQQHQAQQLSNIRNSQSENLLNQFLNMPINNVILETTNKDNSEIFNSPFVIAANPINQQIDSKRLRIEQLQKVSFQFDNQNQEDMFNIQSVNYNLQRDFQQFLQQLLQNHPSNDLINTIRKNQQTHEADMFLSNNQFQQNTNEFNPNISVSVQPSQHQNINYNDVNNAINTIENYQNNQAAQHDVGLQNKQATSQQYEQDHIQRQQSQAQQQQQVPQITNKQILDELLKIQPSSNGSIERKARIIAKINQLNNLDMHSIYKQLFDLECDSTNLKGLWTLIFYHYGKYSKNSIVQMNFKKISNYSQQQPILILNYTNTEKVYPILIVQNNGCYYDIYSNNYTEFSDISRTLDAVSGQNVDISNKSIKIGDQQFTVSRQLVYEVL